MSDQSKKQSTNVDSDTKPAEDLTGQDRLVSNVIFSWGAHFIFIIAGFIMPRMIDMRLGQELLGVWDFAWSLVGYFALVQAGVASSVNRYVSKYRASSDDIGVSRIVSSAFFVLGVAGFIVGCLAVAVSLILPQLFGSRLGDNVLAAQWVVLYLGAGLGIEMAFSVFAGVLTGCHRWEVHNIIKSGWHIVTVAAMITLLLLGFGLPQLALAYLAGQVMSSVTRVIIAHRVCLSLRVRLSFVKLSTIKSVFAFGGKTLIPSVSNLLLNQTVCILIVAYMGPAALALYARPRSLIMHMNMLVSKMALVLTPTASSLQSKGDLHEVSKLLVKSVRYSLYMALPMVLVLIVFGDVVLQLWMGANYADSFLPAILAAGYLAAMVNLPLVSILAGLNAHGRAGLAQLIASLFSVGLAMLVLGPLDLGLEGAAVAVTLPLTVMNVLYLPFYICRKLDLNMREYFISILVRPMICVLAFALCLIAARLMFKDKQLLGLVWGFTVGGSVLSVLYWRYVLPDRIKTWVLRFFGRRDPVDQAIV